MNDEAIYTEAIKKKLKRYTERERDIENQLERIERMEAKLTSAGSPVFSDLPKAPSPSQQRMADLTNQKIDLEHKVARVIERQKAERTEIEEIIDKLEISDEKAVIRMRYLDSADWDSVLSMLFGGREDFLSKEDSYKRRMYKLHGSALLNMGKIYQKMQIERSK
ncbi:MAG: DUF1492 domain-containing protein [Oscillospiraceae bacterium]